MKSLIAPAVVLTASLALGACGGTDSTGAAAPKKPATPQQTTTEEAAPPPPKKVEVSFSGPYEVHRDTVTLRGTVSPDGAMVKVSGHKAHVEADAWSKVVAIKHHGENTYKVVGSAKGYEKGRDVATVTRKLSAAEKAAKRAAEEAARQAREAQARANFEAAAQTISYKQALAHPSEYKGEKVKYYGQILQVQEDGPFTVVLLQVTDEGYDIWDDPVWVDIPGHIHGAEDDMLTVYGTLRGNKSYDTQMGGNTTVPRVEAKYWVE